MYEKFVVQLQKRSLDSLGWARKFIEWGEFIRCIRESYDAAFYAAKAILFHQGIKSKSHNSVRQRIDDLVAGGTLASGMEDVLEPLLAMRNEAAYRFARGNWTEEEAAQALTTSEFFVGEMQEITRTSVR
ncbi:MAG: HEPN domain-containing protein [Acidimicrobiia bacterium]|nr:HEPN domain-containing protein [Acidimicrobiia bacterium]